jgi:hypothetical protein
MTLSLILFLVQGASLVALCLSGLLLGHTYLHSCLIGGIYAAFYLLVCLLFDNHVHIMIEKAIFIQKKARKNKFQVLFATVSSLIAAAVVFNMSPGLQRPPNRWVTYAQAQCVGERQQGMLGMKATFMGTALLMCIPAMVFASAFAVNVDYTGDIQKWKHQPHTVLVRLALGLGLSLGLEFYLSQHPLYNVAFQSGQFSTVYFLG